MKKGCAKQANKQTNERECHVTASESAALSKSVPCALGARWEPPFWGNTRTQGRWANDRPSRGSRHSLHWSETTKDDPLQTINRALSF